MKIEKVTLFVLILFCIRLTSLQAQTVKDIDGNVYPTVTIGTQVWMGENLKTTKYNDGTAIPLVTDNKAWERLTTPAYCWYDNDTTYKNSYGALYNGYAVNTGKLCPSGWHVSIDLEWATLITYLGGESVAGGKLKETGTTHWRGPNSGAKNEGGFTALPGGSRYTNGLFFTIKNIGYWWTFTENTTLDGWYRCMYNGNNAVSRNYFDSTNGFSVRCVRD